MDPTMEQGAPTGAPATAMGLPDIVKPMPFGGPPLPVQGPAPTVVTIDAVMQLLRDDTLRGFKIDVETDTLIEADQQKEKEQRSEFVQAVGEFIAKTGPIAQAMPPLAPLIGGLLQFAVRGFKVGQELEELIESTMHKAGMLLENPPPKPPPPEEMAKIEGIKAKTQAEIQKAQMDMQTAQIEAQGRVAQVQAQLQGDQQKHATDIQALGQKHELEMTRIAADMQAQRERHQMELEAKAAELQHKERQHQMDVEKHQMAMQHAAHSHDTAMEQKQADAKAKAAQAKKGADK